MAPINLKELAKSEERIASGHRLCTGCGPAIMLRQLMLAAKDYNLAIANATCCVEISTVVYPYSSWKVSWYHNAFENAAAIASGVESAYKALKRRGAIGDDFRFIAIGGDGGTYDIGFQALSGMAERGHRVLYICYDNNAYMNTGIQRSGATPLGAWTTTSHAGEAKSGKQQTRKDLTQIMVAHGMPYVAQSAVGYWRDFMTKVQKALETDGPSFINVLAPCWRGWRFDTSQTLELGKVAVETATWPLFEVVNGNYKMTHTPRERRPVTDYLKIQGRFSHIMKPGQEELLAAWQKDVDDRWERLQKLISISQ
ncbi:MAG: thiamine pyrophosphate-dependent enzyme [Chloroflexi bacterium]|nr:thiamine pyrophosphate-dependent enzyme [Chloroflexota bacterium]